MIPSTGSKKEKGGGEGRNEGGRNDGEKQEEQEKEN